MTNLYSGALAELGGVFEKIDDKAVDKAVRMIAKAKTVVVFGGGRERLQILGFAMRLFHSGRAVAVVGDMTTPAIGKGDLFVVPCGPGEISTALALLDVAKKAGAKVLLITAQPKGRAADYADFVLTVPAQTMADDRGPDDLDPADGFALRRGIVRSVRGDDTQASHAGGRRSEGDARQPYEPRIEASGSAGG